MTATILTAAALAGLACGLLLLGWAVRDYLRFVRQLCDEIANAIGDADDAADRLRGDRP